MDNVAAVRPQILLLLAFILVAGFFSLGIFVFVHRFREPIARVFSGICFSLGGIYLLNFFLYVPEPEFLARAELPIRLRWMVNSISPALYLHLSAFYFPVKWRQFINRVLPLSYLYGALFALLFLFTDFLVADVVIRPTQMAMAVQGPGYDLYWAFVLFIFSITIPGLVVSLLQTRSNLVRRQILYLLLPQILLVSLIFVFGNDNRMLDESIVPNEFGQTLLLVALVLFARGVLVYGSVSGRPTSLRRFFVLVLFYLTFGFVIFGLLILDIHLTSFAAFPLPLLTILFIVFGFCYFSSCAKTNISIFGSNNSWTKF